MLNMLLGPSALCCENLGARSQWKRRPWSTNYNFDDINESMDSYLYRGVFKFLKIDIFKYIYVHPRNELAEQLHIRVCLPVSPRHSYRVRGSARGCGGFRS
ncbi:hypothetical protein D8674_034175 [Pyrus ussuriensis x Pyrus communis]|uniref:Uncharacterized protein n=1 Tax=Pyrus ussuriensis x Pyrus communis TaxID=2448454 RepID=A0A5N5HV38_9ROSA|nr:hypothetical protein D8674_034175 [Pyrus ussuriensis x Pyrus communis]